MKDTKDANLGYLVAQTLKREADRRRSRGGSDSLMADPLALSLNDADYLFAYIDDLLDRTFPAHIEALVEKIGPAPVQVIETSSYFGVYRLGFPGDRPRLVAAFAKPHDDSKTNADTFAALLNFFARRQGTKVDTVQAEPAEESAERKAIRNLVAAVRWLSDVADYRVGTAAKENADEAERLLDGRAH